MYGWLHGSLTLGLAAGAWTITRRGTTAGRLAGRLLRLLCHRTVPVLESYEVVYSSLPWPRGDGSLKARSEKASRDCCRTCSAQDVDDVECLTLLEATYRRNVGARIQILPHGILWGLAEVPCVRLGGEVTQRIDHRGWGGARKIGCSLSCRIAFWPCLTVPPWNGALLFVPSKRAWRLAAEGSSLPAHGASSCNPSRIENPHGPS